jgi:hypothetical protein
MDPMYYTLLFTHGRPPVICDLYLSITFVSGHFEIDGVYFWKTKLLIFEVDLLPVDLSFFLS